MVHEYGVEYINTTVYEKEKLKQQIHMHGTDLESGGLASGRPGNEAINFYV